LISSKPCSLVQEPHIKPMEESSINPYQKIPIQTKGKEKGKVPLIKREIFYNLIEGMSFFTITKRASLQHKRAPISTHLVAL